MNPITEAERKLPEPFKAHQLFGAYRSVVGMDNKKWGRSRLETVRNDQKIEPGLELALRNGDYGPRLKGILLRAFQTAGQEITLSERLFILNNYDLIESGPEWPFP